MRFLSRITLFIAFGIMATNAQAGGYEELKTKDGVTVKYKVKEGKKGKRELFVKFKNKSGSAVNVDAEVSFYIQGIQEENSMLHDCLKKSFFDNWFRPSHIIIAEKATESQFNSEDMKIEVTELTITKVDECGKTDSK